MTDFPARVALVGLRGSGKTTLGRALAARLELPFHDADQILQEKEGRTIARIFAEQGQEWFREREAECLAQITRHDRFVLACGGGAVLREENRGLLVQRAFVVWLDADPEILARRICLDPQSRLTRPPLSGSAQTNAVDQLAKDRGFEEVSSEMALLARERKDCYLSVSQLRLDTSTGTPAEWISRLLECWKQPSERPAGVPWK